MCTNLFNGINSFSITFNSLMHYNMLLRHHYLVSIITERSHLVSQKNLIPPAL